MSDTALDRFLRIKNYNDAEEVKKWLQAESNLIDKDILPGQYADMSSLSMLYDVYFQNVPETVRQNINDMNYSIIGAIITYHIFELRVIGIANWSDIICEVPMAEQTRRYIWDLLETYHAGGWDITLSMAYMDENQPDTYSVFPATEDGLDEFKADCLSALSRIFGDIDYEQSFQLFFNKDNCTQEAFILVNCIQNEANGYEEYNAGPFIISGTGDQMKYLLPENIGLPILQSETKT